MARGNPCDRCKERFWRQMLRLWHRSGLTDRYFCCEHDLTEPSFYGWRRTISERDRHARRRMPPRARKPQANKAPAFVPVRVLPAATPLSPTPFEIVLAPGRLVR